jgi:hypothetical protein
MQLLHYQSFGGYLSGDPPTPENPLSNTYLDSAEVVIFYGEQDSQAAGDVSRTILQCLLPKSPIQSLSTDQ